MFSRLFTADESLSRARLSEEPPENTILSIREVIVRPRQSTSSKKQILLSEGARFIDASAIIFLP